MRAILSWAAGALLLSGLTMGTATETEARGLKFSTGAKIVGSGVKAYNRSQRNKDRDEQEQSDEPGADSQTLMGTRSAPSSEPAAEAAKPAAAVVAAAPTPPVDPDAPIVCVAGCSGLPKSYPSGAKPGR